MDKSTVINNLISWSRWKLKSGHHLGYPTASSFTKLVVDNSRRHVDISEVDEWCRKIDEAVESLPAFHVFVIRLEYLSNVREMPMKLEITGVSNKKTYYGYLNSAYEKIGRHIDNKETIVV